MSKLIPVLLSVISFAATAFSQVDGRLTGTVTDPSGASIPEASVSLFLPAGKTPVLTMKTTANGNFDFTAVRPGTYKVEITAKGFNTVDENNVAVDPARETTLPPIQLAIQSTSQAVEVSGDRPTVSTNSVDISSTVTQAQVETLPVLDRQINNLFYMQPGVTNNGATDTRINGLRAQDTNVTLDGINIQDNFIRINGLDYIPNKLTTNEVAELTVSTSNADPVLGGNASAITLVTRSGTNTFHGNAYWYNRNFDLSANDWFNNKDGVARPFLNLNQFGGGIGGPIKKDKLFFFADYEAYDLHETSPTTTTILTPSARQGILTYRTNGNGAIQTFNVIQNPGATPPVTIDPIAAKLLSLVPTAGNTNTVGDGLNTTGYQFNARSNNRRDSVLGRVDYNLSPRHVFSGTYRWNRDNVDRPDIFTGFNVVPVVFNQNGAHLFSVSWRWTPRANLTNQLLGGGNLARAPFDVSGSIPPALYSGTLYTNPTNTFLPQGRTAHVYNINDTANWIHGSHSVSFGGQTQQVRVRAYGYGGVSPTYTLGVYSDNQPYGYAVGDIPGASATDTNTANALLGTLTGLLQSETQSYNVTSKTSGYVPAAPSVQNMAFNNYALYVSDTWKLRRNLTAVLGLRYDYFPSVTEQNGLLLQPQLINNNAIQTLLGNATLNFQGDHLYQTQKTNFAPNVGLAWTPTESVVLRAGYSITYAQEDMLEAVLTTATANSGLSSTSSIVSAQGYISKPAALPTPAFQVPITTAQNNINSGGGPVTNGIIIGNNVQGLIDPHLKTPYVQQWNVTLEKQYKGTIFDAAYVGNHAVGLLRQIDYNQVNIFQPVFFNDFANAYRNGILSLNSGRGFNATYNSAIAGSVPLPFFNSLPNGGNLRGATVASDILTQQIGALGQYYAQNGYFPSNQPGFSYFPNPNALYSSELTNFSQSTYDALQLTANRRAPKGINFQASYVYAIGFTDTSVERGLDALLNNASASIEKARNPGIATHVIKLNHYIPIPAGKGHWFNPRGMSWLVSDWALSGFWTLQTGAPVSLLSARGTLNRPARSGENTVNTTLTQGQLNNISGLFMTGNGPYFISPSVIGPTGQGAAPDGQAPFNGQVFFDPGFGTVGALQRRNLSGPWFDMYNFEVTRRFKFTERHNLDLKADFYNLVNHPNFFAGNQSINSVNFGKITSMLYSPDGVGPRAIQFGLLYRF